MGSVESEPTWGLVRGLTLYCGLFEQLERRIARRHRLRISDLRCLHEFRWDEEIPVRTLAQRLGLSRSRVSRILDRLEEHRLVKRAIDPVDRRGINVHATAKGRRLLEEFYAALKPEPDASAEPLPAADVACANRVVFELCRELSERLCNDGPESVAIPAEVESD